MTAQTQLDDAARRIQVVVDFLEAIRKGDSNATVFNGTLTLPSIAKLIYDGQTLIASSVNDLTAAVASAQASATSAAASLQLAMDAGETYASTADALSNGVSAITGLVGGSGGTNGQFDIAFSGGGGSEAKGRFTVAGGAVTATVITHRGKNYTSAPTISFAASAGLTGASATAVIATNEPPGDYFTIPAGLATEYKALYQNVAGVATDTAKRIVDASALSALREIVRPVPVGELLEDGSAAPLSGYVDWSTGYYITWTDHASVSHVPDVDDRITTIEAAIAASNLTGFKSGLDLPHLRIVATELGEDTERTDLDGTTRIARLIRGDEPGQLLTDLTDTLIQCYHRIGVRVAYPLPGNGVRALKTLVAGAGGTDGTFALAFTGGGGTGAAGTFTVAGGVVTQVLITAQGQDYTSAPAVSFAASAGLAGASVIPVIAPNNADLYLRWRWEYKTGANQDTWHWQDTWLVARHGQQWHFTELFYYVGGGIQDVVSQESSDGGGSIDQPGQAVVDHMGPGHGFEWKTRELQVWIDGRKVTPKAFARYDHNDIRLNLQAKIFRPRAVIPDPLTATPVATIDKNWTLNAREQLRCCHRVTVTDIWTGNTYLPLVSVASANNGYIVTDAALRDHAWQQLALPAGMDDATPPGTEPVARDGVRQIFYSGPWGSLHIRTSDPYCWHAGGFRKNSSRFDPPLDDHRLKTSDAGLHKTYFEVGGPVVNVGGVDYNRFAIGDLIERDAHIQITSH